MPSGQGFTEIDFGTGSGTNEASVAVTGLTSITSTNAAEAFIMYEASSNRTANDHAYANTFMDLVCGVPVDGVGFTIHARSIHKLTGSFRVRYVWA